MNGNTTVLANIIKKYKPNWPKPTRLLGKGAFGKVYNTNNGRVMKISAGNLTREFGILKNLQSAHYVPRVRNGNLITFNNTNTKNIKSKVLNRRNYNLRPAQAFIMSKVGGPHAMTLHNYVMKYVTVNNSIIRKYTEMTTKHPHLAEAAGRFVKRHFNELQAKHTAAMNKKKDLLSNLHVRGFSHGDVHGGNIIVTTTPSGKITGMWLIDFGFATRTPLGKAGNVFNFAPKAAAPNGTVYKRNANNALVQKLAKRRMEIAENLKLLTNSKNKIGRSKTSPNRKQVSGMSRNQAINYIKKL